MTPTCVAVLQGHPSYLPLIGLVWSSHWLILTTHHRTLWNCPAYLQCWPVAKNKTEYFFISLCQCWTTCSFCFCHLLKSNCGCSGWLQPSSGAAHGSVVVGVTVCQLHAALYQLFQELCIYVFHSEESPKIISHFVYNRFISPTACLNVKNTQQRWGSFQS